MKAIERIIKQLENGEEITEDERRVVAYLVREMMRRDQHINGLVKVEMSPEMYERFNQFAYTKNGTYKIEDNFF